MLLEPFRASSINTSHEPYVTTTYLLRRVCGVEGFGCPQGGEVMMLRAVSVLPPSVMTLLDAMNWRGPPLWVGFTDA